MSLKENDLFDGVRDKVKIAIARIKEFEPKDGFGYYVAFSGGKDSIVVKDLVKRAGVKFDIHFNLTTVDPPELIYYVRKYHPEVQIIKPELNMWQLIVKKGMLPTRVVRYCCNVLKEGSGIGRVVVTGVRWEESAKRKLRRMFEACKNGGNKYYLHPIIDWTDKEVWEYIKANNLPYCKLYDEGFKRIGCIGCPMARTEGRKKEFVRWPKFEQAWQRAFAKFWANWHNYPLEKQRWVSCEGKYPFQPIIGEIRSRGINKESGNIEEGFWTRRRWFDLKGYQTWQELWHWWLQDEEETEDCTMGMF